MVVDGYVFFCLFCWIGCCVVVLQGGRSVLRFDYCFIFPWFIVGCAVGVGSFGFWWGF